MGSGYLAITGTIAVALIGLFGAAIVALIQARSNYRIQTDLEKIKFESQTNLEKTKFETELIIKMIETGNLEASKRNLLFLLKAGFIRDPDQKIISLANDLDAVPMLPGGSYEETHGTLRDVKIGGLGKFGIPDQKMENVWLTFRSPGGRNYSAVHVFEHPAGPYILLCSEDRDLKDFQVVQKDIAREYGGSIDNKITDRSKDICATIQIVSGFSQEEIVRVSETLARLDYRDLHIPQLHYRKA